MAQALADNEKSWELWLRRAGLNVCAAQAVAIELAMPDGSPRMGVRHGLGAFVNMPAQERIARFEGVLGGRRVLERASRVLDEKWQE